MFLAPWRGCALRFLLVSLFFMNGTWSENFGEAKATEKSETAGTLAALQSAGKILIAVKPFPGS